DALGFDNGALPAPPTVSRRSGRGSQVHSCAASAPGSHCPRLSVALLSGLLVLIVAFMFGCKAKCTVGREKVSRRGCLYQVCRSLVVGQNDAWLKAES